MGLYLGVEFVRDRDTLEPASEETAAICDRLLELGVIMQPTGDHLNVLKIKPPLCLSRESADFFADMLTRATLPAPTLPAGKIGKRSVKQDIAHVAAIAAAVGDRGTIRVDVNQAWSLTDARYGARGLQEIGCILIEQPVPRDKLAALKSLTDGYEIATM
eukprot:gene320-399_t